MAVSVTTFTDVIAFFVGTNTLLPGLQSFCVYAAVSIFTIYALQITHFVAWFSLGKENNSVIGNYKRKPTIFQYFIPSGLLAGWMDIELHRLFLPNLKLIFFLDQRRQMSARDGCICCFTHKNFKPDQSNKPSILSSLFGRVGLLLTNKCVQLAVMLATAVFLAIGVWGTLSLTQVCPTTSLNM